VERELITRNAKYSDAAKHQSSVNSYDSICRDLALQTGCAIVFPEYTLAPEARWPTQQEQCYAVLKWVRENGEKEGLSKEKIAVVGDSAGGMLVQTTNYTSTTTGPNAYQVNSPSQPLSSPPPASQLSQYLIKSFSTPRF
jgi:hypothetical protein